MKKSMKVLLFLFSVGWLLPLFLSFYLLFYWFDSDVTLAIYKHSSQYGSFPTLYYTRYLFLITFIWVAAATIFWSVKLVVIKNPTNNN